MLDYIFFKSHHSFSFFHLVWEVEKFGQGRGGVKENVVYEILARQILHQNVLTIRWMFGLYSINFIFHLGKLKERKGNKQEQKQEQKQKQKKKKFEESPRLHHPHPLPPPFHGYHITPT